MLKIGEIVEMNVVRVESNEFGSRIILSYGNCDTYRVKAYDFQAEGDITSVVKVKVVAFEPMKGFPILVQDNEWVLQQTFGDSGLIGRNYEFEIIRKELDKNTRRPYLCLGDSFGLKFHRYYLDNIDEYEIGDRIRLHIKALKSYHLELEKPKERTKIPVSDLVFSTREIENIEPVSKPKTNLAARGEYYVFTETESQTLEYKSSIVYAPNSNNADVDAQMWNILRTIAGFMNADGGVLYIGVNDNGTVCGIEGDYQHLNDGDEDEYSGQYVANIDGFELKIRNSVSQHLSSLAGALFSFATEQYNGKVVAKITALRAYAPIYYNGKIIFQRQGNSTRMLKDNELTHFCAMKWFGGTDATQPKQEVSTVGSSSAQTPPFVDTENATRDYSIWHTLYLHKNGGWSFDDNAVGKSELGEAVCSCTIEKYRVKENHRLLFAYPTGNVDVVAFNKVDRITGGKVKFIEAEWMDKPKGYGSNGYVQSQGVPSVFCANPMDMVAVFYECDNKTFAKIVDVSTIAVHPKLNNQGNEIVPKGVDNCRIFHIHHKYHDALRGLTRATRNYGGYDIDNDSKVRPTVQKLMEIIRGEYNVIFE